MKSSKQKLIIENLLSSKDIFSRCSGIMNPEYFDAQYKSPVKFIMDYYGKHNTIPSIRMMNAEFDDLGFDIHKVTIDEIVHTCTEVEAFCQESALTDAIMESVNDIQTNNFPKVLERVKAALAIALSRDIGIEMFSNPMERLRSMIDTQTRIPCGIKGIDEPLDGGFCRKEFILFSANSGGGKSVMLANIAANYAKQGLNVVLISLELSQEMIYLRLAAILTNVKTTIWKENIPKIADTIIDYSNNGVGSLIIKRMPNGSCANDIRSYLKQYELDTGKTPDVLVIDYLDLMSPNGGTKNPSVFQQDKEKSEQVNELLTEFNMIGFSASQQNREALRTNAPDQGVIAGGISKVNTVDYYISLFMDPAMRLAGEMLAFFLKTRSSSAVGTSVKLHFNNGTLHISDEGSIPGSFVMPSRKNRNNVLNLPNVEAEEDAIDPLHTGIFDPPIIPNEVKQAILNRIDLKHEEDDLDLLNLMNF